MYRTLCIEWCMGAIYMCAFTSIYLQIPELYGNDGLLPAHLQLKISCNDKHEKCSFWASHGECENNPTWMKKNCKLSCRACSQKDHAVLDNFHEKPTILWFSPFLGLDTEHGMDLCCLAGVVLSLAVLIMPVMCNKIVFVLLWLLYFSLYQVGQTFLWFQWDILLLEAGFLTILLARTFPSSSLTLRCYDNIVLWLFRWLLFRLMFASGVVKLTSKCPTWWSLTALDWHYESQCIPTPLAWYAHQLPQWFQKLSVVATFVIEIPLPFLFFAPIRNLRLFSFYCQVLLQGMIVLTGNYNFFNLLTILLCISLLDDQFLDTSFQCKSPNEEESVEKQSKFSSYITSAISIFTYLSLAYWTKKLFALGIKNGSITSDLAFNKNDFFKAVTVATKFGIGIGVTTFLWEIVKSFKCLIASNETRMKKMWSLLKFAVVMVTAGWVLVISMVPYTDHDSDHSQQDLWSVVHKWYHISRPYHVVNSYGLFRRMTGVGGRSEIIIEGSNDLKHWKEFEFFYKPGDPATRPSFVAPHQPRIDWQMWFAALGNYQHNPWFVHLIYKLLHSNQSYVASPFSEPPVYVRSTLYIYRYTSLGNHGNRWWKRDKVREYTPPLTKDEPSLQKFIENMGWTQKEQVKSRGALSRLLRFSRRHFETKHNDVKERTSVTITQREACSKSPESSECARKIVLKIQLKDKKDSLQKSKERYLQLIEENKMLKENLIQMEENSYRNVTSILRKYKQYSGAYEALQSDVTTKRLEEKEREFEQISQTKQEEIKSLKKEAEQVQELIEMIRDELTRVNIYKSKDCGDQHQEVQLLNKDIYFMEEDFADELHHLSQTAHRATLAYTKQCACDQGNVKSNIAQEVLDNVDEQVKRMYQWNVHMQKEIGLHSEHAVALEKDIHRLKAEIRQLKYLEAKRRSQAKYPHTSQAKCEPDDDVVLNVAQQRIMPF